MYVVHRYFEFIDLDIEVTSFSSTAYLFCLTSTCVDVNDARYPFTFSCKRDDVRDKKGYLVPRAMIWGIKLMETR